MFYLNISIYAINRVFIFQNSFRDSWLKLLRIVIHPPSFTQPTEPQPRIDDTILPVGSVAVNENLKYIKENLLIHEVKKI